MENANTLSQIRSLIELNPGHTLLPQQFDRGDRALLDHVQTHLT